MYTTDKFRPLAMAIFRQANVDARLVVGTHPFGGRSEEEARETGRALAAQAAEIILSGEGRNTDPDKEGCG
jgi:hypothetical protein